jgi:hypothetical protein
MFAPVMLSLPAVIGRAEGAGFQKVVCQIEVEVEDC